MRYFKVKIGTVYADRFVGSDTDFGFAQNDSGYKTVPTKRTIELSECRITTDFVNDADTLITLVGRTNNALSDVTGMSANIETPTSVYYMLGMLQVEETFASASELDLPCDTDVADDGEYLVCEHLGIQGRYTERFAPERVLVDIKYDGRKPRTKERFSGNFDACLFAREAVERYLRDVEERTIDERYSVI